MRLRKCPECGDKFQPTRQMQPCCDKDACREAFAIRHAESTRKRRQMQRAKADRIAGIEDRKAVKAKLENLKTARDWTKEAQVAWNFYVRMRDYGKPCASCGAMPEQKYGGTMDCSHFRSVGAAPHLRFHLHNAAAACVRCNRHLSGNIAALRVGMIERIGIDKVEAIESNNGFRKFDIPYLKRIKDIFTKKGNIVARRVGVR